MVRKKFLKFSFISLILSLVFLSCFVPKLFAADIPLKWDPAENATSYEVEMSTDLGNTWSVPVVADDPNNPCQMIWYNAPDTGLLLFRCGAVNAGGLKAIRYHAGVWWNGSWAPPKEPVGMGAL